MPGGVDIINQGTTMQPIWAPWRMEYVLEDKDEKQSEGCVFCIGNEAERDKARQVLYRGNHGFIVMNRYPYSNGHLLVIPFRHVCDLSELSSEEGAELFQLLALAQKVLLEKLSPQGFNIGMNLGSAAGAGIPGHLHWHIVPRWQGDTNFMPVVGELKVIPQHLQRTYETLVAGFVGKRL
jgi:ATP adenylyltransferase